MRILNWVSGFCAVSVILAPALSGAMQCNVCHSKNPKMVKMHRAIQAKEIGCFDCHRIGEKLMGKARPKDLQSLFKRRVSESPCTGCHTE